MRKTRLLLFLLLSASVLSAYAIELDKENRDPNYVTSIVERSRKIVDKLGVSDPKDAETVCNIIANRYFELNDIYEVRDTKVKQWTLHSWGGEPGKDGVEDVGDAGELQGRRRHDRRYLRGPHGLGQGPLQLLPADLLALQVFFNKRVVRLADGLHELLPPLGGGEVGGGRDLRGSRRRRRSRPFRTKCRKGRRRSPRPPAEGPRGRAQNIAVSLRNG